MQEIKLKLVPYHHIEIDNTGAFKGMSTKTQSLVLVETDADQDQFYDPSETSAKASKDVDEALKKVESIYPGLKCYVLQIKKAIVAEVKPADKTNKANKNASDEKEPTPAQILAQRIESLLPEEAYSHYVLLNYNTPVLEAFVEVLAKRWGSTLQLDGIVFADEVDTKLSTELNSPYICLIPKLKATDKQWAVSFAALNAAYAGEPSRPYQNIKVPGLESDHATGFKLEKRNQLLKKGISTWRKQGKDVIVDRLVTTYVKNTAGADDPSYRDLNTLQTLSEIRYDFRNSVALAYPRHMLAKDEFPYKGAVVTPKMLRAFCITKYRQWQNNNLVQDPGGEFKKRLTINVSKDIPGKVDIILPIHVMGQWRITQTSLQFEI